MESNLSYAGSSTTLYKEQSHALHRKAHCTKAWRTRQLFSHSPFQTAMSAFGKYKNAGFPSVSPNTSQGIRTCHFPRGRYQHSFYAQLPSTPFVRWHCLCITGNFIRNTTWLNVGYIYKFQLCVKQLRSFSFCAMKQVSWKDSDHTATALELQTHIYN